MIKVTRILIYEYPDQETAEKDQERWGVPATGSVRHGDKVVRSVVVPNWTVNLITEGEPA